MLTKTPVSELPLWFARTRAVPTFGIACGVLVAVTALRLVGLHYSTLDLYVDEAQYWIWSRELAFGYESKPPLIAWIISAATQVCGDAEACVRAPAPIIYLASSLVIYALARALYDARVAFWAALSFGLAIGVAFSARIISTDLPLLCCWALALLAYVKLLSSHRWRWAILLGASIGLGLLAKYAMIYFLLGVALAAALDRDAWRLLGTARFWLAIAVAALVIAPNLAWNFEHRLATFQQTHDNIMSDGLNLDAVRALAFIGSQFGILGPILFAVLLAAIALVGSSKITRADRLMIAFAIPPLALITAIGLVSHANANWAVTSFISGTVVAVALLVRRRAWKWLAASIACGVIAQAALLAGDTMAMRVHVAFLDDEDGNGDPYNRTLGWRSFSEEAGGLARRVGAKAIIGVSREEVAALRYYWRDQPEQILAWPVPGDHFGLAPALTETAPQPLLYVSKIARKDELVFCFASVEPFAKLVTPTGPTTRRSYVVAKLDGFRGPIEPPCR
jgi:hypothetical protein